VDVQFAPHPLGTLVFHLFWSFPPKAAAALMWTPLITLIALVLLTAAGAATGVALTTPDHQRAARALTLIKILVSALLGSGGMLAAVIRLHQAGLL
jgi:hypothetical protein